MKRRNNAMMNYAKRGAALLLALVFCLGLLPPADAEGDTITIHDASGSAQAGPKLHLGYLVSRGNRGAGRRHFPGRYRLFHHSRVPRHL
ncbi:MAG: hypothetical protein ACLRNQ_28280 [Flavonifractor plautii]